MGQAPSYSYFVGCSDVGREALQEAHRFPNDFNGTIAGSPVNDQVGEFGASYLYNMQATLTGPQTNGIPDADIPASKLPVLTNAVLARCVGKDGGVAGDAFLNDPRQCKFDPSFVQCSTGQDPNTCLTPAQVQAAQKLYAGPKDHVTLLFPGLEPGGEAPTGGWSTWLTGSSPASPGSQFGLGFGFGCSLMQGVTSCDCLAVDVVAQDNAAGATLQPILSSVNPDLSGFKAHGGKLIQYAGWSDAAIPPQNGLNYYRKVVKRSKQRRELRVRDASGFIRSAQRQRSTCLPVRRWLTRICRAETIRRRRSRSGDRDRSIPFRREDSRR